MPLTAHPKATESYLREVRVLAAATRSPKYVSLMELRMNAHVLPYFKDKALTAINKGTVQSYRVKRAEETIAKPVSISALRSSSELMTPSGRSRL